MHHPQFLDQFVLNTGGIYKIGKIRQIRVELRKLRIEVT